VGPPCFAGGGKEPQRSLLAGEGCASGSVSDSPQLAGMHTRMGLLGLCWSERAEYPGTCRSLAQGTGALSRAAPCVSSSFSSQPHPPPGWASRRDSAALTGTEARSGGPLQRGGPAVCGLGSVLL